MRKRARARARGVAGDGRGCGRRSGRGESPRDARRVGPHRRVGHGTELAALLPGLADASRLRFSAELEKQIPNVIWLDQLPTVLAATIQLLQSRLPEPLRNKIQLNPN